MEGARRGWRGDLLHRRSLPRGGHAQEWRQKEVTRRLPHPRLDRLSKQHRMRQWCEWTAQLTVWHCQNRPFALEKSVVLGTQVAELIFTGFGLLLFLLVSAGRAPAHVGFVTARPCLVRTG